MGAPARRRVARAEEAYRRALDSARRVRHPTVSPLALAGMAAVHLLEGRSDDACAAATEGRDLYRAGTPRRFRHRIDLDDDLRVAAAVCCDVLAAISAEAGDPEGSGGPAPGGRGAPAAARAQA